MGRQYGLSGGLAGAAMERQSDAMKMMGQIADQEQQRELENKRLESQRKQGNQQLGASAGAMVGYQVGGPWGAAIGGIIGAVGGRLF